MNEEKFDGIDSSLKNPTSIRKGRKETPEKERAVTMKSFLGVQANPQSEHTTGHRCPIIAPTCRHPQNQPIKFKPSTLFLNGKDRKKYELNLVN